jgi:uncharacterized repeat protein (TIGR02543 family)
MKTASLRSAASIAVILLTACSGGGGGGGSDPGVARYTVVYSANGATGGSVPVDAASYQQGATVLVLGNTGSLERTGYSFSGWNTAANGSGTSYAPSATFAMGAANVTLFAQWTLIPTYGVTYDANGATGGTVPVDPAAYQQGQTVTVPANTGSLVRTGFTFSGWNTQADGAGTSYAAGATFSMGSANVTLYARWLSAAKAFTTFAFVAPPVAGTIDQQARIIRVLLPFGADVTSLVASFATTGVGVTVNGVPQTTDTTANDFTSPVSYVVTAADQSTASFQVSVVLGISGDLDKDGTADLVTLDAAAGQVLVSRGNGDGTFRTPTRFPVGSSPTSAVLGDFNRDGTLDLAVANGGSGTASILIGKGDGTFFPTVNVLAGPDPTSITTVDVNSDSLLDLSIANSAGNGPAVLLGKGDGTFWPLSYPDAGRAVLQLSTSTVAFGGLSVGDSKDLTVTAWNAGTDPLTMGTVGGANPLAAPFTLVSDTCSQQTLAPAASCTLTLRYAPVAVGLSSDTFDVPSSDSSQPSVTLAVTGSAGPPQIALDVSTLAFGNVALTTTASQVVTLANTGFSDLVVTSAVMTGDSAFAVAPGTCPTTTPTLGPGSHCTLVVSFHPMYLGPRSGTLTITSNDPSTPTSSVSCLGAGL